MTFRDREGGELDLDRSFGLDDDRDEIAHFLREAGFLHIREVFEESEMDSVARDIDLWIDRATPDDGDSWWAETADGEKLAVRVLNFFEKSFMWATDYPHPDHPHTWVDDLTRYAEALPPDTRSKVLGENVRRTYRF